MKKRSINTLLKATDPCNGCQREEHDKFGPCSNFEMCPTLRAHIELRHEIHKLKHKNKVLDEALNGACEVLSAFIPSVPQKKHREILIKDVDLRLKKIKRSEKYMKKSHKVLI